LAHVCLVAAIAIFLSFQFVIRPPVFNEKPLETHLHIGQFDSTISESLKSQPILTLHFRSGPKARVDSVGVLRG